MRKCMKGIILLLSFTSLFSNDIPLFINAAKTNDFKTVSRFIENKNNINAVDEYGKTALMWASEKNNINIVKYLLDNGADVNIITDSQYSVLHYPAQAGNTEVVKLLLTKDVSKIINSTTKLGWTPLICASSMGHVEIVKLLMAKGADKSIKAKNGVTAIGFAEIMGFKEIIKILK